MKPIFQPLRCSLLILKAITLLSFTSLTVNADPIEDANSYAVRVKSSVRYAAFFDSAGTADGAGFLVDKKRGLILSNAHIAGYGTASLEVSFKRVASFL